MKKLLLSSFSVLIFITSFSAHAELTPRSLSADSRVKVVTYDPNNVVLVKGKYGYETQIVFAPNETVQNVSIGDSLAWQVNPVNNNLFVKPVTYSNTNMTVLTNINSYNFQLNSISNNFTPTYKLQFIYPDGGYDFSGNSNALGTFDPNQFNWKYSYTGSIELKPQSTFDNGQFTYFQFKKGQKIPAIFTVDKDRKETLINYHVQGNYIVVNTTGNQFTLRNGSYVTCIYNDKLIGDWEQIQ